MSFLPKHPTASALIFFAILVALFYSNALGNGFIFDDRVLISAIQEISPQHYLGKIFFSCPVSDSAVDCTQYPYYRPLPILVIFLSAQITYNPWLFHLVQILLFWGVGASLFMVFKELTKNLLFAFAAAVLFLVNPLNTEVVNWISTAADPLHVIFALWTIFFTIRFRRLGSRKHFAYALFFYFLGMLSKESAAFIIPLLVFTADTIFVRGLSLRIPLRDMRYYLAFLAPAVLYIALRAHAIGLAGGINNRPVLEGFSFVENVYMFFALFAHSLKTMLMPYPSLLFHDIVGKSTLLNGEFLLFAGIAILFASALFFACKKRMYIAAFSLLWFLLFFLQIPIFSSIAGSNIFAERLLFGASAGYAGIIAWTLTAWAGKGVKVNRKNSFISTRRGRAVVVYGLLICVSLGLSPIVRAKNNEWKNMETLLRANVARTPTASHLREALGDDLRDQGKWEEAKNQYEELLARDPGYQYIDHVYSNLADYYKMHADIEKARIFYRKAVEAVQGNDYRPYNNAGIFFMQQGHYLEAVQDLCRAVLLENQAPEPQANIQRFIYLLNDLDAKQLGQLTHEMQNSGMFQKGKDGIVEYKDSTCGSDSCSFSFSTHFNEQDVVLPFFIFASVNSRAALAKNPSFDPQTGTVSLDVSLQFGENNTVFLFHTCQGIYYETTAN